jgi:hypothetical protein
MKNLQLLGILTFGFAVFFTSCKKDNNEFYSSDIFDALLLQQSSEDSEKSADLISLSCIHCSLEEVRASLDPCAQITNSGDGIYPRTIIIDYGTVGCGTDEKNIKRGKILINISAEMTNVAAVRTITYENFSIGGRSISGNRSLVNIGNSDKGELIFEYNDEIQMSYENKTHKKLTNGRKIWASGYDTYNDCTDDFFSISGSSTMTIRNGQELKREILEPISIGASCQYPLSGAIKMNGPRGSYIVNFGEGNCDNEATLTNDKGEAEIINLDDLHLRRGRSHRR